MSIQTLIARYSAMYAQAQVVADMAWHKANCHTAEEGYTEEQHAVYADEAQLAEGYKNTLYAERERLYTEQKQTEEKP
jgi:hypothetical protein